MNLIGITGGKNQGKDTVAKIINLLTVGKTTESIIQFIEQNNKYLPVDCTYETRRFADPLKRFVADILGVPVEKLEDREFKEKELGKEWEKDLPYTKLYPDNPKEKFTPRKLLQQIGTEIGRSIHPQIWINSMFKNYIPIGDNLLEGEVRKVRKEDLIYPKWIIPDVRFNNEAVAIKERGGIIIRVNRDLDTVDTHASEQGVSDSLVDIEIDNNGTIKNLIQEVKTKLEL